MPGSIPVGGGVDGPIYADYQDVTDQQQLAGAANAVREKLNLVPDTLVLTIAKFSGEVKLYAAKSDSPVVPPYIKLRSSGSLETTKNTLDEMQKEFMRFVEMLPPKLRVLLLKNMGLPKQLKNPELNGFEKSIQQHIQAKLWARRILNRFKKDEDEERREQEGIFTLEEEEDLLPQGTVVPETHYVPIAKIDPYEQTPNELTKQLQANTVFMLEYQLGVLKLHLASLETYDPARELLKDFPRLISRMIRQSKAFVNIRNFLDFEKAKKVAFTLEQIDPSIIQEQRRLVETAQRYSADRPSLGLAVFATAMLNIAVLGCQLLRTSCSLSALCTEGSALLHGSLLTSSSVVGKELIDLTKTLGNGFQTLGLSIGAVRILQMVLLCVAPAILIFALDDVLPILTTYSKETAERIINTLETSTENEESINGEKQLNNLSQEAVIRLAAATATITHIAYDTAQALLKNIGSEKQKSFDIEATSVQLITLLSALLGGSYLFEKMGDANAVLFGALMKNTLEQHTKQLQYLVDNGEMKPQIAEALNSLRLSELAFEGQRLSEQLISRERALEALGIHAKDLKQGSKELVQLASSFAVSQAALRQENRTVTPNVSVLA